MQKILSLGLFLSKETRKISFLEISKFLGVSERTAKRYIKKDLENGFITRERTTYQCRKYKTLLSGRNIYHLTEKGKAYLLQSQQGYVTPQSFIKKKYSSKEEFAKGKARDSFSQEKKNELLEKHHFGHLIGKCPPWWFRNFYILEKTLRLLNQKKRRGYKAKNEKRWISSVIRDQGRGFRHKVAKKTSLTLANNRKELLNILECSSDRILTDFDRLKELKKRGLNTSFEEMEKLLRKGFSHLASCAEVLLKISKWRAIKNLNGFLNWLVSLKEPFEIFNKKNHSADEIIQWAQSLFKSEAKNCVFDTRGDFKKWVKNPSCLDRSKCFVQFHIFQDVEKSFINLLQWESEKWEDKRLKVTSPFFKETLLNILGDQKHLLELGLTG